MLHDSLCELPDGRWAASQVAVVVPRRSGKGELLIARQLAGLYLFEHEQRILASAHEFRTVLDAFQRLLAVIENSPDLKRGVLRIRYSHGQESILLRNGSEIRFIPRTSGSARGLGCDLLIMDEAMKMPQPAVAALLPTLATSPNSQTWFTSSAPLPGEQSDVLRQICRRGRAGNAEHLAYFEWCADPDADPDDRDAWAQANPAYPHRITEATLAGLRHSMGADFNREMLGIWEDDEDDITESVLPMDAWRSCLSVRCHPTGPVALAFDVSTDRKWSTIAVSDGRVVAVESQPGTSWLPRRIAELVAKHQPVSVAANPLGPAGSVIVAVEREGVAVHTVTTRLFANACGTFVDAVISGCIEHAGQAELDRAVEHAATRPAGEGAFAWSASRSRLDICPLIACTLAHWAARQDAPSVYEDRELLVL